MKKIIGIIGVCAFAMTMFMNTNYVKNNDSTLASLIAINVANAEYDDGDICSDEWDAPGCTFIQNGHAYIAYDCEPDTWYTLADCM